MPLPFSLLNGEEPIRTTENTQRSEFEKRGQIRCGQKESCGFLLVRRSSAIFRISFKCFTHSVTTYFRHIFSCHCGSAAADRQSQKSLNHIIRNEI